MRMSLLKESLGLVGDSTEHREVATVTETRTPSPLLPLLPLPPRAPLVLPVGP